MDPSLKQLLDRMVVARQLSSIDAEALARVAPAVKTEEDVLRWLANEYGLAYTTLEDLEPDRQLLSLFPARILLKEELLPLQRVNGHVEVAKAYYSVPPEYLGRSLWARWDGHLVRVFNEKMQSIAVHAQREPGKFSTR